MNEKDALEQFYACTRNNDLSGALAALKFISIDTLNKQDDDDYDMLISAVMNNNLCAVEALLTDGRCDWTHYENLCGMRAIEHALNDPDDPRMRNVFWKYQQPDFIYRDGKVIPGSEIFQNIMDGTIDADEGCFTMLDDSLCIELLLAGRIDREDFKTWTEMTGLDWKAQIALLAGDEEYGKEFVNWDEIRREANPDEWLSFLRDLPQYAGEADWDKLIREGSVEKWQELLQTHPEYREKYLKGLITKYFDIPVLNLHAACKFGDAETVSECLKQQPVPDLNKNFSCSASPEFLLALPLALAVQARSAECVKLLTAHGADPDARCGKLGKTPRELAKETPGIENVFNPEQNCRNDDGKDDRKPEIPDEIQALAPEDSPCRSVRKICIIRI